MLVSTAYQIACKAHNGQVDKAGRPYIEHPLAVAAMVATEEEKVVALLHDTVEDSALTLQDLQAHGLSSRIVNAIDCLTKQEGQSLEQYLSRVKSDPLATTVKIADLTHNSDLSRIPTPTQKDYDRAAKYQEALVYLRSP